MPRVRSRALIALTLIALATAVSACSGRRFGRQYEYEEQLYLSADGSASIVVNSSIPALIALHGLPLDPSPRARIDRNAVRAMVSEGPVEISKVSRTWRRDGRQFIQIVFEVEHVGHLPKTKLFRWSEYALTAKTGENGEQREYFQRVRTPTGPGAAAGNQYGWNGSELVAFKLHLPSRIREQNARDIETNEPRGTERGNIVTWEQRLTDRLQGKPVELTVLMDSGSILYRTLGLFAVSFVAAILLLTFVIWRVIKRGRSRVTAAGQVRP